MDFKETPAPAPTGEEPEQTAGQPAESVEAAASEELLSARESTETEESRLRAVIEAAVYVTDEPLTARQIAAALEQPLEKVRQALAELVREYERPEHGLTIREVAEGYKMGTKPEHHEAIRSFVKKLKPPLKLSMAALETLAVVAYKQPITAPEIMEIRGVQGAGVLKTLLDRKLITTAGRKPVVGRPILYKTTKEFLVQFGLKNLSELPTLKEFEELARMAMADSEPEAAGRPEGEETASQPAPQEPPRETAGPVAEGTGPEETPSADAAREAGPTEPAAESEGDPGPDE